MAEACLIRRFDLAIQLTTIQKPPTRANNQAGTIWAQELQSPRLRKVANRRIAAPATNGRKTWKRDPSRDIWILIQGLVGAV
jgi:hypothetical protein